MCTACCHSTTAHGVLTLLNMHCQLFASWRSQQQHKAELLPLRVADNQFCFSSYTAAGDGVPKKDRVRYEL